MITIGSNYFFKGIGGFKSKDHDFLKIVDKGIGFNNIRQITTSHSCIFSVVRKPKAEIIKYALEIGPAMGLGKFLIPEFNKEFDITIDDLKILAPLKEKLDDKHKYEAIIFDAYIENGSFELTPDQLNLAFDNYKLSRQSATAATPTASATTADSTVEAGQIKHKH